MIMSSTVKDIKQQKHFYKLFTTDYVAIVTTNDNNKDDGSSHYDDGASNEYQNQHDEHDNEHDNANSSFSARQGLFYDDDNEHENEQSHDFNPIIYNVTNESCDVSGVILCNACSVDHRDNNNNHDNCAPLSPLPLLTAHYSNDNNKTSDTTLKYMLLIKCQRKKINRQNQLHHALKMIMIHCKIVVHLH